MGKLIVIEGTDGSGKATQTGLLVKRVEDGGRAVKRLEFPRYKEESSALVRLYLGGSFGSDPKDVNAYAASTFFAVDRFASFKQDWQEHYENGGLVITDRYTTSNAVHQAEKLPDNERNGFVDWLFDFEYRLMGLPKPDVVIYLDMPTGVTRRMMAKRREETGATGDIHEDHGDYLARCRMSALGIAEKCGWKVIDCAEGDSPRTPESIHEEIYSIIEPLL